MTNAPIALRNDGLLANDLICKHCHGSIAVRNPTGLCDHLYFPDMLTDEAKHANGFCEVTVVIWHKTDETASKIDLSIGQDW